MGKGTSRPRPTQIHISSKALYVLVLCLCMVGGAADVYGQQADSAEKIRIHILNNKVMTYTKTDTAELYMFVGDVVMQQGTDTLYCDSLYQDKTANTLEAFSNVRIAQQGGTQGTCDYLRYVSAKKLAYMSGNVVLTDGRNHLYCEELTYDLGSKTGVYTNGGRLENDSTVVTSNSGVYNANNKDARFTGHAIITDPQYKITSEDILYNTETKLTRFYAKSTVVGDSGKSILKTTNGTYDGKNGVAHFTGHSTIWNDGQYIEGDSLYYSKLTGYGLAIGNVISIDTTHHSTLYCGRAEYFQKKRVMWASIKPVLEQVNGTDTLYMRADTFYSAPMAARYAPRKAIAVDSLLPAVDSILTNRGKVLTLKNGKLPDRDTFWVIPEGKYRTLSSTGIAAADTGKRAKATAKRKQILPPVATADTTGADTLAPQFFIGYHHVLLFSDSLQGKCDSIAYTRSDSVIRMIYNPIAWSRKSQITGDTIRMQLDSSHIKSLYVPNNAFMVSLAGPELAELYDQVQGKTLLALFEKNTISNMVVKPNSESVYYNKDEAGAYLGVSQSKSDQMHIIFADQQINKIKFVPETDLTMTPLDKVNIPEARLSRFRWLLDQRPASKEELFK